jgi:hypothetical protein
MFRRDTDRRRFAVRHVRLLVSAVLAVALWTAPAAAAHPPQQKGGGAHIAPIDRVGGLTGGELLAESWARSLTVSGEDPYLGGCAPVAGTGGKLVEPFPSPEMTATCTVRPGTKIAIWPGSECSNVEEPPFFGRDEAEQRACAIAVDQAIESILVSVDGSAPVDIRDPRYELISPQRTVQLPPGNVFGVDPQPATFVAHSWAAVVRHLTPGRHTIAVEIIGSEIAGTTTITIDVVPCGEGHDGGGKSHRT